MPLAWSASRWASPAARRAAVPGGRVPVDRAGIAADSQPDFFRSVLVVPWRGRSCWSAMCVVGGTADSPGLSAIVTDRRSVSFRSIVPRTNSPAPTSRVQTSANPYINRTTSETVRTSGSAATASMTRAHPPFGSRTLSCRRHSARIWSDSRIVLLAYDSASLSMTLMQAPQHIDGCVVITRPQRLQGYGTNQVLLRRAG